MGRLRAAAIRVSLDTERNRNVPPEINQKNGADMDGHGARIGVAYPKSMCRNVLTAGKRTLIWNGNEYALAA